MLDCSCSFTRCPLGCFGWLLLPGNAQPCAAPGTAAAFTDTVMRARARVRTRRPHCTGSLLTGWQAGLHVVDLPPWPIRAVFHL